MLKIAAIGDIHGREDWKIFKKIINDYQYIVFIGDYVDSAFRSDYQILKNLNEIIEFKLQNNSKVILLKGNHEIQYQFFGLPDSRSSGFRPSMLIQLKNIFEINNNSLQYAFQYDDLLFTHSGLLTGYYNKFKDQYEHQNYAQLINSIAENNILNLLEKSPYRNGKYLYSSPVFTDWKELTSQSEFLPINQIVGHSYGFGGEYNKNRKYFIINVDVLNLQSGFFEISLDNNKKYVKKVNIM